MLFLARGVPPPNPRDRGLEGTRGNKKESRDRFRRGEEHLPPSTTQQTPRYCRVLQGTVILRPQRRGLRSERPPAHMRLTKGRHLPQLRGRSRRSVPSTGAVFGSLTSTTRRTPGTPPATSTALDMKSSLVAGPDQPNARRAGGPMAGNPGGPSHERGRNPLSPVHPRGERQSALGDRGADPAVAEVEVGRVGGRLSSLAAASSAVTRHANDDEQ
jgi:hypothetical protein